MILKQVIKSRILADCWKRHPRFGTIPIEIFVMSVISSTSYTLPPVRPWDPSRHRSSTRTDGDANHTPMDPDGKWEEGKVVTGHPNICPLLDFFEDNHYYYLVLPSSIPEKKLDEQSPPIDLFDLVEAYPQGLPSFDVRSYLGQLADALCFLHSHGIGLSFCVSWISGRYSFIVSSPRRKRRERCPRTKWQMRLNRLWKFRSREEEWMGHIQWDVSFSRTHSSKSEHSLTR